MMIRCAACLSELFSPALGREDQFSVDFHRKDDLLVTASEDDLVRLYDIASAKLLKTTYHRKHGADRLCFTHHPSSVICSSVYHLDSTELCSESLRYLSMYDNRCLRYFKGHKAYCFFSNQHRLEFCIYAVDPQLHTTNKVLSLLWQWKWVLLNCDSRSYDKGPFDTFLVGGGTAEVCDIKFSDDGKSMLLTTTCNNICVLDAYSGDKALEMELCMPRTSTCEMRCHAGTAT